MAKNVKLLLIENVDSLGIVGDVVNVRTGFARNFLLPRALATTPNDELVKSLAAKRADAEKMVAQQRTQREQTTEKLQGVELELVRACNDQGILYGAITQQEVATQLGAQGMVVKARDVRLPGAIKRIDKYDIHIKMDSDLDAIIKLTVKPDRELPKDAGEPEARPAGKGEAKGEGKADGAPREGKPEGRERKESGPDFEGRTERRDRREDREDRREKNMRRRADAIEHAIATDKARVVGWGVGKTDAAAGAAPAAPAPEGEKKPKGKKSEGDAEGKKKGEKKSDKGDASKK
ncbi:50S ribosomal protein L9 [Phycisphaerales bacterium]|nr:50S ribosomal protein L9 [Phycisphaerales bacterium]